MKVETIGVVGAGQMGNGIAHVAALAGFRVVLHDIEDAFVRRGLSAVGDNLQHGSQRLAGNGLHTQLTKPSDQSV